MRSARAHTAAAVASTLAVMLSPATAHAAAPGDTVALPVRDALHALTVQTENRTGYERSKFRHWVDADRDSCNTRQEVLLEEPSPRPSRTPTAL